MIQIDKFVLESILNGDKKKDTVSKLSKRFGVSSELVSQTYTKVKKTIASYTGENIEGILNLHASRYEHIYNLAQGYGLDSVCKAAMRSKERLVGIRKELLQDVLETLFSSDEDIYSIDRLDADEKHRFFELFKKSINE